MRKGLTLVASAVAMAISGSAFSAGPAFDDWSVTGGKITVNGTHSVVAGGEAGSGFIQYTVESGGNTYIGTVVTDANANTTDGLGFSDQSFVLMDFCSTNCTNNNGIKSKQTITEMSGNVVAFQSVADIQTGTHFGADASFVRISQELNEAESITNAGDNFMTDFLYEADLNATTGEREGYIMEIDQRAGLGDPGSVDTGNGNTNPTMNDVQAFTYREAAGTKQTGIGALTIGSTTNSNGGTITGIASGAAAKAVWIGQEIANGGGNFGYLSYDDKSNTTAAISGFSLTDSAGPGTWSTAFDLSFSGYTQSGAPTVADPSGGRAVAP